MKDNIIDNIKVFLRILKIYFRLIDKPKLDLPAVKELLEILYT